MGGNGSGRWYRWQDKRTTLNALRRVDVRALHRGGSLRPGASGVWTWYRGDTPTGHVAYTMQGDTLVLDYQYRSGGGEWQQVTHAITLVWTPCHYGGMRPWFRCPQCHRRVAVLALGGRLFLCRHCTQMPYASQCETPVDRFYRKARKIRDKVGASHNLMVHVWRKPKGMHWRTFERLCAQEREAHLQALHALLAMPL